MLTELSPSSLSLMTGAGSSSTRGCASAVSRITRMASSTELSYEMPKTRSTRALGDQLGQHFAGGILIAICPGPSCTLEPLATNPRNSAKL